MDSNENSPCVIRVSISDMVALRVRAQASGASNLPKFLYQQLPSQAMGLMATLPTGDIQVSIPHKLDKNFGYPIQKDFLPADDGFILTYALQPNRRYEAIEVFYQGGNYPIGPFCSIAKRWARDHEGTGSTASGNNVYMSPDVEQWGVIRRDSGYIAVDPATFSFKRVKAQEQLASGVSIRMVAGSSRPSFLQVALKFDPDPGESSHWLSFNEYRSERARKSRLPKILVQSFRNWKEQLSEESGLKSWIFSEGMLFLDRVEWWGNKNRRRTEHEGIDFALGKNAVANVESIPPGTPIRAIMDGEAVAVLDDFLGKTVLVRHPAIRNEDAAIFYTLYSHIQPANGLTGQVAQGQILGRIGESKPGNAPMHLHLTAAWIPQSIPPGELTMNHIQHAFAPIILIDFFESLSP